MALGRRPREVYRAFSEEQLLEDRSTMDLFADEPVADAADGGPNPLAHTSSARRARALAVTLLATLLGSAVGLAAVSLIGVGKHRSEVSSGGIAEGGAPLAGRSGSAVPDSRRALGADRGARERAHDRPAHHAHREWSRVPGRRGARISTTPASTGGEGPVPAPVSLAGAPVAVAERASPGAGPPGNRADIGGRGARETEFGFER
jgi:hypothetical protein